MHLPQHEVLQFALRVEPRELHYIPRDSATRSGILGKERSSKCLGIERTLPGVIDPRVKIAAKRNRDARVIAIDSLGEA